jgi:hypothetical protein
MPITDSARIQATTIRQHRTKTKKIQQKEKNKKTKKSSGSSGGGGISSSSSSSSSSNSSSNKLPLSSAIAKVIKRNGVVIKSSPYSRDPEPKVTTEQTGPRGKVF